MREYVLSEHAINFSYNAFLSQGHSFTINKTINKTKRIYFILSLSVFVPGIVFTNDIAIFQQTFDAR